MRTLVVLVGVGCSFEPSTVRLEDATAVDATLTAADGGPTVDGVPTSDADPGDGPIVIECPPGTVCTSGQCCDDPSSGPTCQPLGSPCPGGDVYLCDDGLDCPTDQACCWNGGGTSCGACSFESAMCGCPEGIDQCTESQQGCPGEGVDCGDDLGIYRRCST